MKHENVLETLKQLQKVTFDGDLISKACRDWLVDRGLAQRGSGYNWLTEEGVRLSYTLLLLENC